MKLFLLSIPDSLLMYKAKINLKSALCNKAWAVFNEDGIKQVFYFKRNGEVKISTNGDVAKTKWEIEPIDNSIILYINEIGTLFHPLYMDEMILALKKDGCDLMICLIDIKKGSSLIERTTENLNNYLENQITNNNDDGSQKKAKRKNIPAVVIFIYIFTAAIMLCLIYLLFQVFIETVLS